MKRTNELIIDGKKLIQSIRKATNVYAIVKLTQDDETYIRVYKNDAVETVKHMIESNPDIAFEASEIDGNLYMGW